MRAGWLLLSIAVAMALPAEASALTKRGPPAKTTGKAKVGKKETGRRRPTSQRAIGKTREVEAQVPAAPVPATPPARRLTRDQRHRAALRGARKALAPWAKGGLEIEPLLERKQIQLTPGKFLGRGPVRVLVRPKITARTSGWERLTRAFRPNHNRRVLLAVNETGTATVLADEPDAIQHRLWRAINRRLPIAEITRDIVTSDKSRAGLLGAMSGVFAWSVRPEVAVGVALVALGYVGKGVRERQVARQAALDETVTWIREGEASDQIPALSESYRFYQAEMEQAGSRPISLDAFVEEMSYRLRKPSKDRSQAAKPAAADPS